MPMDDREQQFQRALGRLLRDAAPESHCPDAETLSAYHERSLPSEQMSFWKEHISGCARCQEILTLVEQSENVPAEEWERREEPVEVYEELAGAFRGAGAEKLSQTALRPTPAAQTAVFRPRIAPRARWRWLVPIGAVAAAAIVVVGIREIQMQKHKEAGAPVQMARNQEPAQQQATAPFPAPTAAESMQQLNQQQRQVQALEKTLRDQKQAAPAAPKIPPASSNAMASSSGVAQPGAANAPELAPPRETHANSAKMAAPVTPAASDLVTAEKDRSIEALTPPAPAPTAVGAAKKSVPEEKGKVAAPSTAEIAGVQADAMRTDTRLSKGEFSRVTTTNLLETAAADHRYIIAPGVKSVWHVGDGGKIERSTDQGKTWKEQNSGVTADLTAGSAASDKVCWVIGKSGTILVSVDGGRGWRQVNSPIGGDIGGIHATDAMRASIWDVANHASFATSDGGTTWGRIANE